MIWKPGSRNSAFLEQGSSHGEASANRFRDREATERTRFLAAPSEYCGRPGQTGAGHFASGRWKLGVGHGAVGGDAAPPSLQVDRSLSPARRGRTLRWKTAPVDRRSFPPEVAIHLVKIACERPDEVGRSLSHWDCAELARQLIADEVVEAISPQTVQRILANHKLNPDIS